MFEDHNKAYADAVAETVADARRLVEQARVDGQARRYVGTALDGAIQSRVDGGGQVVELVIHDHPRLRDHHDEVDFDQIAAGVQVAVNAALANRSRRLAADAATRATELGAGLHRLTDGFADVLEQVANDIARVQR